MHHLMKAIGVMCDDSESRSVNRGHKRHQSRNRNSVKKVSTKKGAVTVLEGSMKRPARKPVVEFERAD